jgi:hypothetical protein
MKIYPYLYTFVLAKSNFYRYVPLDPVRLRTGDIVEAQVSFTAVPLKGRRHKMLLVLRAVTLLDSSAVHVSRD